MKVKKRSRSALAVAALVAAILPSARAEEPSVRDLIALAPVLDSAEEGCRSLDIGGYIGDDKGPGPRLRFRALYRAPDRFSLLLSDPTDGTPLAFCSGRKIFVYDPVSPAVYYSENSGFRLEMNFKNENLNFQCNYLLWSHDRPRILLDLRSVLAGISDVARATNETPVGDVVKLGENKYKFSLKDTQMSETRFYVDLFNKCHYTSVAFVCDGRIDLCLDNIGFNVPIEDDLFAFPAKERLGRSLPPIKQVTAAIGLREVRDAASVVSRAGVVRAVVNRRGGTGPLKIPGLSDLEWDGIKANDKLYSKALRELIPPSLRAR